MKPNHVAVPQPFWHRINQFFAFPFQSQPLGYALLLSLGSLLFKALFFLPAPLAIGLVQIGVCLLYTSPSPRDRQKSRMPSSA